MNPSIDKNEYGDNFLSYVEGLDEEKVETTKTAIDGLDLDTSEGLEEAKRILAEELDLHFKNAEGVGKEAIDSIRHALDKHNLIENEYDISFIEYIESLDNEKAEAVRMELDGLDLDTPEGLEEAKRILAEKLDINFKNAEGVSKETIESIIHALDRHGSNSEDSTLYKKNVLGRTYNVTMPPPEKLSEYKEQVEEILSVLQTRDREKIKEVLTIGNGNVRGDLDLIMETLETHELTEQQFILFAIAIFTGVNRSQGLGMIDSAKKFLTTPSYPLDQTLEAQGQASCIDVSILTKILAVNFGIQGALHVIGNSRRGHRIFISENGEVIDGWHPALFIPSTQEFKDSIQNAPITKETYDVKF
ncbi:hypothetical protein HOG48_05805 [Candidatus Peregrinibacteria bacterium]|jgi:hypothetical protein|nr:hypothetical protein [Candidatus Peregrinibacteria bacterium]